MCARTECVSNDVRRQHLLFVGEDAGSEGAAVVTTPANQHDPEEHSNHTDVFVRQAGASWRSALLLLPWIRIRSLHTAERTMQHGR